MKKAARFSVLSFFSTPSAFAQRQTAQANDLQAAITGIVVPPDIIFTG
jgi:hypothetical protein